jgi:membrane protease YdiL (CAAX protease family)
VGCLLAAQVFAILWAGAALSLIYDIDDLPSAAERPIWSILVLNLGLWIGYVAAPFVVRSVTGSGRLVDFDLRVGAAQAGFAALLGVVAQLALLPALYWVVLKFVSGDPGRSAEDLLDRVDGPIDVVLLVLAVVVIAPVVEEWFYRGMLLPALARRFGPLAGAIGSSAVFALVHQEPILLPGLFGLALLLAWLTMRTARIGPAIVAHMAFNATTVVQLLVF